MRLACLLLMGFIPIYAFCQSHKLQYLLKEHPFDSLGKYSYLIITWDTNHLPIGAGTGFFYRKEKRLFLVSAYHVFSGKDILEDEYFRTHPNEKRTNTGEKPIPDEMEVWYMDVDNNYRCQRIPLDEYKKKTRIDALRCSDVDAIDASQYFTGGRINSIEQFAPDYDKDGLLSMTDTLMPGDTVVAYGFTNVSKVPACNVKKDIAQLPNGYVRWVIDTPKIIRKHSSWLSSYYQYVAPKLKGGASGAPVFRIKTDGSQRRTIEFIGIQSSSRKKKNKHSAIVKKIELYKLLNLF